MIKLLWIFPIIAIILLFTGYDTGRWGLNHLDSLDVDNLVVDTVKSDVVVQGDIKPQLVKIPIINAPPGGAYEQVTISKNSNQRTKFACHGCFFDTLVVDSLVICTFNQADSNIIDSINLRIFNTFKSEPYTVLWGDGTNTGEDSVNYFRSVWTSISGVKISTYDAFYITFFGKKMAANDDIQIKHGFLFGYPQ